MFTIVYCTLTSTKIFVVKNVFLSLYLNARIVLLAILTAYSLCDPSQTQ